MWLYMIFPAIHFEFGNFSLKRKATFGHRSSGLLVQASGLVSSSFSLRMVMVKTHLTSKWSKPRWNIRTQAMDPLWSIGIVSWFTVTVKRIFDLDEFKRSILGSFSDWVCWENHRPPNGFSCWRLPQITKLHRQITWHFPAQDFQSVRFPTLYVFHCQLRLLVCKSSCLLGKHQHLFAA